MLHRILKKYTAFTEFPSESNWKCCLCSTGWSDAPALWSKEWSWAGGGNAARSSCPHSFKNQGNFFPSFWTWTVFSFTSLYCLFNLFNCLLNSRKMILFQLSNEEYLPSSDLGRTSKSVWVYETFWWSALCHKVIFVCVACFCFILGTLNAWSYSSAMIAYWRKKIQDLKFRKSGCWLSFSSPLVYFLRAHRLLKRILFNW